MATEKIKLEKAVLAVLAYSAQFNHPLTAMEITKRMLTNKGFYLVDRHLKLISKFKSREINQVLASLVKQKKILKQDNFFTLANQPEAFIKRQKSQLVHHEKAAVIAEFVQLIEQIPWVLGATITGSHAVAGTNQDDIDFLIITQKNRLWLTRIWLLFQSACRGRRPHLPNGDLSHSWDLNFWLDETKLTLSAERHTVYEAYEMLQTRWVFERQQICQRFYVANSWVAEYLQHWSIPSKKIKIMNQRRNQVNEILLNWLDWLVMFIQLGYRTIRHGKQRAGKHNAFFHLAETRQKILKNWQIIYQKALKL